MFVCVKAAAYSFFLLFLCFFVMLMLMHASTTPSSPLPNTVSHRTIAIHTQKIEEKHNKVKKFGGNGRVTLGHSMLSKSSAEDLCKKYNKPIKEGTNGADCKSSHHKALLQFTKSEDSRWAHLNVREMDSQYKYSSIFSEEINLSETDYQPPHRKSPIHNK